MPARPPGRRPQVDSGEAALAIALILPDQPAWPFAALTTGSECPGLPEHRGRALLRLQNRPMEPSETELTAVQTLDSVLDLVGNAADVRRGLVWAPQVPVPPRDQLAGVRQLVGSNGL